MNISEFDDFDDLDKKMNAYEIFLNESIRKLHSLRRMLPEDTEDEALRSIISIQTIPPYILKVVCHLTHKFRLIVQVKKTISIIAENRPVITCTPDTFVAALKKEIYYIDEAIDAGTYKQSKKSCFVFDDRPPAPDYMDIPMWDEKRRVWYDAEY